MRIYNPVTRRTRKFHTATGVGSLNRYDNAVSMHLCFPEFPKPSRKASTPWQKPVSKNKKKKPKQFETKINLKRSKNKMHHGLKSGVKW